MLGTNGGGFFNANSAHPFENPNALTNFVEMVLIFSIGAALTNVFGRMVERRAPGLGDLRRHGRAVPRRRDHGLLGGSARQSGLRRLQRRRRRRAPMQAGGNMEGKEVRFGIANSALFATVTTDASCGAVNSMHDSFMPLGGMVPLVNIAARRGDLRRRRLRPLRHARVRHRRRVRRRADGRAHARISRQEDRGQGGQDDHPGAPEPAAVDPRLDRAWRRCCRPASPASPMPGRTASARSSTPTPRPPATTAAPSPASAPTRSFYNTTLAFAMLIGRFILVMPLLAVAGSLAQKKIVPPSAGTFPTHSAAVRRPAGRRDRDHRRPDLFPGGVARPGGRAGRDDPRHSLSRALSDLTMNPKTETAALIARPETLYKRSLQPLALFDRTLIVPAIGGVVQKARSAHAGQEPGHVRGRDRLGADDVSSSSATW